MSANADPIEPFQRQLTVYAKYAVKDAFYRPDDPSDSRTVLEHDLSSVIYSNAFKRMSNKSQIIVRPIRDHFRSRLAHTHEVADIACALGKRLNLNLGLTRAIAFAHDLGHTPFGHAGERAIEQILSLTLQSEFQLKPPDRAFSHASNSARILAREGDISTETCRGVLVHSWNPWKGAREAARSKKGSDKSKSAAPFCYEAQVVAIADQLAGINHDIEDLITGRVYTNHDARKLRDAIIAELRSAKDDRMIPFEDETREFITDEEEKGYGRRHRITTVLTKVTEFARGFLNERSSPDEAAGSPLGLNDTWCIYLDTVECTIRRIISTEAWFVGRDAMAAAMVSVAFNHLWPSLRRMRGDHVSAEGLAEEAKGQADARAVGPGTDEFYSHFAHFFEGHYKGIRAFTDRVRLQTTNGISGRRVGVHKHHAQVCARLSALHVPVVT